MTVRRTGRSPRSALSITSASPKPRTSSTATVTTVMKTVTPNEVHQTESVRMTP